LLQRPRLRELMGTAVAEFAWIVIDSPPLNLFADSHCLSTLVDGVLFVVREGLTSKNVVEEAKASLSGAFVAGVVVNWSTTSNYKYGLYESYGAGRAAAVPQADSTPASGPSSSGK
jgi:Mrp family chromosome partitioning ATPase